MKHWMSGIACVALLAATSATALANLANPDSPRKPSKSANVNARMSIEPSQEATEARLVIPRAVWRNLRAELEGPDAGTQAAALTGARFNAGGPQTAMAGLFLSLAFAFGGVWLVRARKSLSGRTRTAALGVALVMLAGASAASIAYANAGPPPVARSLTSKILIPDAQWYGVYGQVKVELVDEGDQIRLVLPKPKEKKD